MIIKYEFNGEKDNNRDKTNHHYTDKIPIIHLQFMSDNGRLAETIFQDAIKNNYFIGVSLVPNLFDKKIITPDGKLIYGRMHPDNNYYRSYAKGVFKEYLNEPNFIVFQEGTDHCCWKCKTENEEKGTDLDVYHEHVCPSGGAQSLKEQIETIKRGKNLLNKFGITKVNGYCPANQLFTEDTLKAAEKNGFRIFLTRNIIDYLGKIKDITNKFWEVPMYQDRKTGLVVIPEAKWENAKSPGWMVYYQELVDNPEKLKTLKKYTNEISQMLETPFVLPSFFAPTDLQIYLNTFNYNNNSKNWGILPHENKIVKLNNGLILQAKQFRDKTKGINPLEKTKLLKLI